MMTLSAGPSRKGITVKILVVHAEEMFSEGCCSGKSVVGKRGVC